MIMFPYGSISVNYQRCVDSSVEILKRGAEAEISRSVWIGRDVIIKNRVPKSYRHPDLDASLRASRTLNEARLIRAARLLGVHTPLVYMIDESSASLVMEEIKGKRVKDILDDADDEVCIDICKEIGKIIASLHRGNIVHGDLTTSNMIFDENLIYLIDFSLGFKNAKIEDMGVDLHLLKEAFQSAHFSRMDLFQVIIDEYTISFSKGAEAVKKMKEIEGRGRYT